MTTAVGEGLMEKSLAALAARPIEVMPFAGGDAARELLRRCGVKVASDIEALGCTGAAAAGLTIEEIGELRLSIAGGGVGLPCFVDIDRFCLAHNTIGGLQPEQAQRHADYVATVSRDLTPEERGKIELMKAAQNRRGKGLDDRLANTLELLSGRELPEGFEGVDPNDPLASMSRATMSSAPEPTRLMPIEAPWVCSEHTKKINWSCRYCVAQAVVEGQLVPGYAIHADDDGAEGTPDRVGFSPEEMLGSLDELAKKKAQCADVYVHVARFEWRFVRVED